MGRVHRFQSALIKRAIAGVEKVLGTYNVLPEVDPDSPNWLIKTAADSIKKWLHAEAGGLVERQW